MSLGRDKVLWLFLYSTLVTSVTLGRWLASLVGRWMPRSHHPGALRHPSSSKEGKTTTPALRATPPHRRRGRQRRRFAPPLLIEGRENNAGASRHPSYPNPS